MMRPGDPKTFWGGIENALRAWGDKWSPVRWRPWRALFWNREGFYVLARGALLTGALTIISWPMSSFCGPLVRAVVLGLTILFLADIVLAHADVAFVRRKRANVLRSALLAMLSFFQIPLSFAVFHLYTADGFNHQLTIVSALYFSVVTATTLGYGDIYPKTGAAQALVVAEILTSLAFLSAVLARLIALATTPSEGSA